MVTMNRTTYIDGDTLSDIRNAHGCGVTPELMAAQVGTSEDALRRLLGLPHGPIQGDLFKDQPVMEAPSQR